MCRYTSGKWQMANGKWQMANGKWQMANGKWHWQRMSTEYRVRFRGPMMVRVFKYRLSFEYRVPVPSKILEP